jgi:hypothetical protein
MTLFYTIGLAGIVLLNRREFDAKMNQRESPTAKNNTNSSSAVTQTKSWPRSFASHANSNAMEVEDGRVSGAMDFDGGGAIHNNGSENQAGPMFALGAEDDMNVIDDSGALDDLSFLMVVQEQNFWEDYITGQALGPSTNPRMKLFFVLFCFVFLVCFYRLLSIVSHFKEYQHESVLSRK